MQYFHNIITSKKSTRKRSFELYIINYYKENILDSDGDDEGDGDGEEGEEEEDGEE